MTKRARAIRITERVTNWIGSVSSLVLHTLFFAGCFIAVLVGAIDLSVMLLMLTTVVSLEAIYLAIFIQMTVNTNTESLREVEEDIDEIQEDVEELGDDLDEIQEDIEEMQEDDEEDERRDKEQAVTLEQLTENIRQILTDIEQLKGKG
jgi:peptidoglycan hydrolase CwlO-like protein